MQDKGVYIPSLTSVRAVAAYAVFCFHFNAFPPATLLGRLLGEGDVGVTIFFVLSSFLIPLRYADQVVLSRHWLKRYFQNRLARIYPLYTLLTALTFLAIGLHPLLSRSWQHRDTAVTQPNVLTRFL